MATGLALTPALSRKREREKSRRGDERAGLIDPIVAGDAAVELEIGVELVGFVVLSMVTTLAVTGLYVIVPTFALGLVQESVVGLQSVVPPGPVTVVSASSDVVSV